MEPCQFRQGNPPLDRVSDEHRDASMEPCQFRQGNVLNEMRHQDWFGASMEALPI